MPQAFTLACEFMYTAEIEELEDAEVAINVWMVASALVIRDLPRYAYGKVRELLPSSHLHILPGLFRQAHAAWQLSRSARAEMEEQGSSILQAVLELMMCKMQVRPGGTAGLPARLSAGCTLGVQRGVRDCVRWVGRGLCAVLCCGGRDGSCVPVTAPALACVGLSWTPRRVRCGRGFGYDGVGTCEGCMRPLLVVACGESTARVWSLAPARR